MLELSLGLSFGVRLNALNACVAPPVQPTKHDRRRDAAG
jgi:hypothetical protein